MKPINLQPFIDIKNISSDELDDLLKSKLISQLNNHLRHESYLEMMELRRNFIIPNIWI